MSHSLPNIIWIVPDSVRYTHTNDELSKLAFMDTFAQRSIEFTRMYTTAPGTLMSFLSIFTGMPCVYVADHYQQIKQVRYEGLTLYQMLKNSGYHNYFFTFYRPLRECFPVFQEMKRYVSDKEFKRIYYKTECGAENREVVTDFLLRHQLKEPFCLMYHAFFAERKRDYAKQHNFSEEIQTIYDELKRNYCLNNTIILIHPDHGYPIYDDKMDKEAMWTHDLVMNEDNLRIPFYLQLPDLQRAYTTINHPSSLIDIFPTLANLLGYPLPSDSRHMGIDLLGEAKPNRFIRSDNRLERQTHRLTSWVQGQTKMIYNHDNQSTQFFQLENKSTKETFIQEQKSQTSSSFIQNLNTDFLEEKRSIEFVQKNNREIKLQKINNLLNSLSGSVYFVRSISESDPLMYMRYHIHENFEERWQVFLNLNISDLFEENQNSSISFLLSTQSIYDLEPNELELFINKQPYLTSHKVYMVDSYYNLESVDNLSDYTRDLSYSYESRTERAQRSRTDRAKTKEEFFRSLDTHKKRNEYE